MKHLSAKQLGTLATALTAPALLGLNNATAQNTSGLPPDSATELAPIQVKAESNHYNPTRSASQKFTAPLLNTAKSVQVIPAEIIQEQAASSLTDVLRNTPGITFGAGEGGNPLGDRPFIRGYDAQGSTFIDGMRDIGASSREVFNLEQVEVTKGSDGAYGGRGGAGGSINLISKTAKAETFNEVNLGLGTDNYYRTTLDSNLLLTENTAFRLNAMYHDADVAGRDIVKNKRWGVAPTITFGLNTPTRATLSYYHLHVDDIPDSGIPYEWPRGEESGPAHVDRRNFYGLTSDYRKGNGDMATIDLEHDLNDKFTLRNTSRYTRSTQQYVWTQPDDSKGNVANGLVWRRANTRDSHIYSLANLTELSGEFQTYSLKHSFNVGMEFSREKGNRDSLNVNRGTGSGATNACGPNGGIGATSNYECTSLYYPNPHDPWVNTLNGGPSGNPSTSYTNTRSVFAYDTIEFNPQWQTGLGVRLDNYRTRYESGTFAMSREDTLVNYQLGLTYKPVSNGSIYVSYATSSTPFNASAGEGSDGSAPSSRGGRVSGGNSDELSPEKNRTIELGTKWAVFDEAMTLSAAVFRTETTNARVTLQNGDYDMAGKKQVNGFELGATGALSERWSVYAGYTYLDAELKDNGPTQSSNDGNRFPNTPKQSFSLWTSYKPLEKMTIGAGAFYTGKQYGDTANKLSIPSWWRFDAMASYQINKHVGLQLNVQNLANKVYFDKAYSAHYASIAAGRSTTLNLRISY